jgi:hypothetical protein
MKTFALIFSLALNFILGGLLLYVVLQGCAEVANGRIGILYQDIRIGLFSSNKVLFTLPKGLVVRDASATGAGWFEPNRFRIGVTSDNPELVDYSLKVEPLSDQQTEHYSVEVIK